MFVLNIVVLRVLCEYKSFVFEWIIIDKGYIKGEKWNNCYYN